MLSGIIFVLRTGCCWRDAPGVCGRTRASALETVEQERLVHKNTTAIGTATYEQGEEQEKTRIWMQPIARRTRKRAVARAIPESWEVLSIGQKAVRTPSCMVSARGMGGSSTCF